MKFLTCPQENRTSWINRAWYFHSLAIEIVFRIVSVISTSLRWLGHLFYSCTIWSRPSEKMPLSKWRMCGFTSSCACAKYHLYLCSPFTESVVSNDSFSRQQSRHAQADLGLCCRHMPKDTYLHGTAQLPKILGHFNSLPYLSLN